MAEEKEKKIVRFGDHESEKKLSIILQQTSDKRKEEEEERRREEESLRTGDLKDLSIATIIREIGDGRPALIGHVNALARRIQSLESFHFEKFEEKTMAETVSDDVIHVKKKPEAEG
tara:strand:- start:2031 stop:2381 length:351 start_codon:yes stop_codon:yes gene_type:complete